MASSHLPTGPQALKPQIVDLHSIKPWPSKPWPMQPKPPTTARSQAWLSSINQACKTLGLHQEQARQQYHSTYRNCKRVHVQPAEPASSYTLAQLVTEVYKLQHRPRPGPSNDPLTEGTLLYLLYFAIDKQKYGIGRAYMPGTESEDSKLISAAAHYLERQQQEKARASTKPQQSGRFFAASLHTSKGDELLSKPVKPHQPVVATPIPTKKRKFDSSSDQENPLPRPFKHTRLILKPFTSNISSTVTATHSLGNSTYTLYSSPPQPQLKLKSATLNFGNRIEQAMLKIDKWADSWLSGAMPQTDLAWDSFEFCLCMPDILEEGQVVER